jgi:hypothetical protein
MNPTSPLKKYFSDDNIPKVEEIHGLVVVPKKDALAPASKRQKLVNFALRDETGTKIVDPENWQRNKWINTQAIGNVTDFPDEYFIRKESIDIFKLLKDRTKQIVLVGSPGVGKSLLLVLYSFWVAFENNKKKSVVLARKIKGEGQGMSVIFLNALDPQKNWKMLVSSIEEVIELRSSFRENSMLCLDGFNQSEINQHWAGIGSFSVLATSAQYQTKSDDSPVLDRCLVPFWSFSDLKQIGTHKKLQETVMKKRYYFSGGNLRSFLLDENDAKKVVDSAVDRLTFAKTELLKTKYGSLSDNQVDHIRMGTVKLGKYSDPSKWSYVICSAYSLMKLGEIVTLEYYKDLCTKAYAMKDFGLFGVAFENHIHVMARQNKEIKMCMRVYDLKKSHTHQYSPLTFTSDVYLLKGDNQEECESVMSNWNESVTYWYPASRSLKTIDCVAKLKIGQVTEFGFLQITKSKNHSIDPGYLNKIGGWFPRPYRYIAVVPNQEIADEFRLQPSDPTTPHRSTPSTSVPLFVAYVDDPFFKQFTNIEE